MAEDMSDRTASGSAELPIGTPTIVRDTPGAPWEKRGNTLWVGCPGCKGWFPVSPVMARPEAPPACCPHCHQQFKVAPTAPR
jgi:hypothetical protein